MNLIALELPDEIREWPAWLEQQLVGLRLRKLVQQLELIGREPEKTVPTIDSVLGECRQAVLDEGLKVLEESQLIALVRNPRLLVSLQQLVLLDGGSFWRSVPRTEEHTIFISQQWLNLRTKIEENDTNEDEPVTKPDTIPAESGKTPSVVSLPQTNLTNLSVHRRWLIGLAALAATILVLIYSPIFQKTDGRFFAAQDIRESQLVGNDYLRIIATRIQSDWKSNGADERAFEKQLTQLRDSCDVLLVLDLHQLDPAIATDLKKRCQNWKAEFSKHIAELASGTPLADVRAKSNALVDRLIQAIINLAA